jgi:hypothetical protein
MPVAQDSLILDAIEAQLKTLPWAKVVETENIRLHFSDLGEHECPYLQVYDNGQVFEHQRGEVLTRWQVAVELALRSSSENIVNMRTLLNYRQDVEQCIGSKVNLGIPGVINVLYLSNQPDIQIVKPFYVTILLFEVVYRKRYVSDC